MRSQEVNLFLFLSIIGAFLSGIVCRKRHSKIRPTTTLIAAFQYDPGKTIFYSLPSPISSMIARHIYEGLTKINNKGDLELAIAKEVHISPNRKEFRFLLRESLWSDGSPLTAYDFERHWHHVLTSQDNVLRTRCMRYIKGVSAFLDKQNRWEDVGICVTGPYELTIILEDPCSHFLRLLSTSCFMPRHIGDENNFSSYSNGPFTIASWQPSIRLLLKKNPYFREIESIYLDEIEILFLADNQLVLSLLDQGNIDFAAFIEGIPCLPKNKGTVAYRLHIWEQSGITALLLLNKNQPPLHRRSIRKAFCQSLQNTRLFHEELAVTTPATTLVSPYLHSCPFTSNETTQDNISIDTLQDTIENTNMFQNIPEEIVLVKLLEGPKSNVLLQIQDVWERQFHLRINKQKPTLPQGMDMVCSGNFQLATLFYSGSFPGYEDFLHIFGKYGPLYTLLEDDTVFHEHLYLARIAEDQKTTKIHLDAAEEYLIKENIIYPLYYPGYICAIREGLENISLNCFFQLIDLSRAYWKK